MTEDEKIFLIECLLRDVRNNFANRVTKRVKKAEELCEELGGKYLVLANCCKEFLKDINRDGRYFRDDFPHGYYEMDKLYSVSRNLQDKSKEFQETANKYITYPEYLFKDMGD